jgi:Mce-associated membrane protein
VRNRWLALGACVVLVGVVAFELYRLTDDRGLPSAPAASRDVARDFAVAVTSFDHKRIDADLQRVLSFGSAGFEREFRAAMGANFVDGVKANKRVSTGKVIAGPTVQRVADGRASYLVVVSQQIVSEGSDTPAQQLRVAMLLSVSTTTDPKVESVQVL